MGTDRTTFLAGLLLGVVIGVVGASVLGGGGSGPAAPPGAAVGASATASAGTQPPDVRLPVVRLGELPEEAATTLALIDAGGPYPFRQDGAVFENREGLLPDRPTGYYHEFTVPRPGNNGRGVLRIVTGAEGERYWTADHYASFAWIER